MRFHIIFLLAKYNCIAKSKQNDSTLFKKHFHSTLRGNRSVTTVSPGLIIDDTDGGMLLSVISKFMFLPQSI